MTVRVIDPIHQCEISNDHDMQESSCFVVVSGIGTSERILPNSGKGRSDRFTESCREPLHELHDIDRDEQPVVHPQEANRWSYSSSVSHLPGPSSSIFLAMPDRYSARS